MFLLDTEYLLKFIEVKMSQPLSHQLYNIIIFNSHNILKYSRLLFPFSNYSLTRASSNTSSSEFLPF